MVVEHSLLKQQAPVVGTEHGFGSQVDPAKNGVPAGHALLSATWHPAAKQQAPDTGESQVSSGDEHACPGTNVPSRVTQFSRVVVMHPRPSGRQHLPVSPAWAMPERDKRATTAHQAFRFIKFIKRDLRLIPHEEMGTAATRRTVPRWAPFRAYLRPEPGTKETPNFRRFLDSGLSSGHTVAAAPPRTAINP